MENEIHMVIEHDSNFVTRDEKVILDILKTRNKMSGKELFNIYQQRSKNPLSFQPFKKHLSALCSKGLVRSVGEKRWRQYECVMVNIHTKGEVDNYLPEWAQTLGKAYRNSIKKRD